MDSDWLLLVMVSFLVVALMLLSMMFFLVLFVLFLINLMKRVGTMLFVLMMNFVVLGFMLMVLDGVVRFWLLTVEPFGETLVFVLLLF